MHFFSIDIFRVWVAECTRAKNRQTFQSDVSRSVFIRICGVAARLASKLALGFTVCLFSVAANAASPGCIAGVDPNNSDSRKFCLVRDHFSQFSKSPAMQPCPFTPSCPDPRTNAGQILYGNRSIRALRVLDNLLGNNVIRIAGEPAFFSTSLFQQSLCRFRSLALQFLSQGPIAVPDFVHLAAGVAVPIGVAGDLNDSHINTDGVNGLVFLLFRHFNCDTEQPLARSENQIGFAVRICEKNPLLVSANEGHLLPAFDGPNIHQYGFQMHGEDASVVGDTSMRPERPLDVLIQFVCVGNLGGQQADNLRGERELASNRPVEQLLDGEPSELFLIPHQLRKPVGGGIGGFQRRKQQFCLLGGWKDSYLHSEFHDDMVYQILEKSIKAALKGGDSTQNFC